MYTDKTHLPEKGKNIHDQITPDKTLQSYSRLTVYVRSDCKSKWQEQTNLERIFWCMRGLIIEIFGDFSQIWDKIAAGIQFLLVGRKTTRLLKCWRLQSYCK